MQIIKNDNLVDARFNIVGKKIKKKVRSVTDPGITLTNNEIKDIQ